MKTISWQAGAEKAGVQIPVLMYSLDPLHLWQHTCENHSESFKRAKGKQSSEELPIAWWWTTNWQWQEWLVGLLEGSLGLLLSPWPPEATFYKDHLLVYHLFLARRLSFKTGRRSSIRRLHTGDPRSSGVLVHRDIVYLSGQVSFCRLPCWEIENDKYRNQFSSGN